MSASTKRSLKENAYGKWFGTMVFLEGLEFLIGEGEKYQCIRPLRKGLANVKQSREAVM